jgi:hypothetical protein
MSTDPLSGLLGRIVGEIGETGNAGVFLDEVARASGGNHTLIDMAARRLCAEQGHRYRVHGKKNPTKVECARCGVTWAIGARTEPKA